MATELTVSCPKCGTEIPITQALAAPLLKSARKEFEQKLQKERAAVVAEEEIKARQLVADELGRVRQSLLDARRQAKLNDLKLEEAQKSQADFLRKERELAEKQRELDLTIEQRVRVELGQIKDQAKRAAEDEIGLRLVEKEHTISAMQKQIEDLGRRASQGSQQLQGEAQEIELEKMLKAAFPNDRITPVPKGEYGGDIIQRVVNAAGIICGTILWESKRTKSWSDAWLPKLREDQRAARADISAIVTQVLPKGIETFGTIDGVWIMQPINLIPVTSALRYGLIEVTAARQAGEGVELKAGQVYEYFTGLRFKQHVQAIVEAFSTMKKDLDQEKKTIGRQWAKRDEQLDRVIQSTVGFYGTLQGIVGKSVLEIEELELKGITDGR